MKKWLPLLVVPFVFACSQADEPTLYKACETIDDCDVGQECGEYVCAAKTAGCWIDWACTDDLECKQDMVCHKALSACAAGECGNVVKVPAGSFTMGCADDDPDCQVMSKPAHEVTFAKPFYIDQIEVTVADYAACTAEAVRDKDGVVTSGCENPDISAGDCNWEGREGWPVVCVNWYQASKYCEWNAKRLCTEAEWEYAARGPEGRVYPWDDVDGCDGEPTCEKTNFVTVTMSTDPVSCGDTLTLAALPEDAGLCDQTPEGAYYMAGNAWEWTQDFLHDTYVGATTDGSEWSYKLGGRKVARGGRPSFDMDPDLRLHRRYAEYPPQRSDTLGFRCCADFKCEVNEDCPGTGMECFEKSNGMNACRKAPVAE